MHPPGQMVTEVALAQGLGSAVVTADAKPHPESTSSEPVSETVRYSPQEDIDTGADTAEIAKGQAADIAAPDSAESEASRTEEAGKGFSTTPDTATETSYSRSSPAIVPANDGGADDEEEDDLIAAIRGCKKKDPHRGEDAATPLPQESFTASTTHTNCERPQRELPIFVSSANDVLVTQFALEGSAGALGSSFLGSYDYTGRKQETRQTTQAGTINGSIGESEENASRVSRKRRFPERCREKRKKRDKESSRHRRRQERQEERERTKKQGQQGVKEGENWMETVRRIQQELGPQPPREQFGASSRQSDFCSAQQINKLQPGQLPKRQSLQEAPQPDPPSQGLPRESRSAHGLERSLQPGSSHSPEQLQNQSIIDAIKNRQPGTAGDNKRTGLQGDPLGRKSATGDSPSSPTTRPEDNVALFQTLAAKAPEKRTTQVVKGPTEELDFQEHNGGKETPIRCGRLPSQPSVPSEPSAPPLFLCQWITKVIAKSDIAPPPLPRCRESGAHSVGPPRETVPAAEALGPDRTVIQYVVYRTPRFIPPANWRRRGKGRDSSEEEEEEEVEDEGGDDEMLRELRKHKAVRCSEHCSAQAANEQAAERLGRPRKGVVGKSWALVRSSFSFSSPSPSLSSTSRFSTANAVVPAAPVPSLVRQEQPVEGAEEEKDEGVLLYEGRVSYANGEVQFFWVGEEVRDVGGSGLTSGLGQVRVDREAAASYVRKRFDVWSRVVYLEKRGEEQAESGQKRGQGRGQKLVFECAGDEGGEGSTSEKTKGTSAEENGMDGMEKGGEERSVEDVATSGNDNEHDNDAEPDCACRSPSVSSTATVTFLPYTTPLDLIETETRLEGSYTTLYLANQAALAAFLELARPRNRGIDDHHHYQHSVRPEMVARFKEHGLGKPGCTSTAELEFEPPAWRPFRWGFLKLVVEVVQSELRGPVDIGDMVVEGDINGRQSDVADKEDIPAVACQVEEESESEVSEEE
ncbi:hypothetical protein VTH82DRAFT_1105 [Thermothelomyces myriococcoides]